MISTLFIDLQNKIDDIYKALKRENEIIVINENCRFLNHFFKDLTEENLVQIFTAVNNTKKQFSQNFQKLEKLKTPYTFEMRKNGFSSEIIADLSNLFYQMFDITVYSQMVDITAYGGCDIWNIEKVSQVVNICNLEKTLNRLEKEYKDSNKIYSFDIKNIEIKGREISYKLDGILYDYMYNVLTNDKYKPYAQEEAIYRYVKRNFEVEEKVLNGDKSKIKIITGNFFDLFYFSLLVEVSEKLKLPS